jgi:parvulin-like peptidyl-prolyl isomerase
MVVLGGCGIGQGHPAATVNGHDISMADFDSQVQYQTRTYSYANGLDVCKSKSTGLFCKQLKKDALNNLIGNELVREYASRHGIEVTKEDIDRQWAVTFQGKSFRGNRRVLDAFLKRMNMTLPQLKERIGQDMLRQAVAASLTEHMPQTVPALRLGQIQVANSTELDAARAQLRRGVPFTTVAAQLTRKKNSLCARSGACGDLGWVPEELIPPTQRSLMTAKVGQIVGPVTAQQGSLLYLLEGREAHYTPSAKQRLSLRQVRFQAWLDGQQKKADVKRYVAT